MNSRHFDIKLGEFAISGTDLKAAFIHSVSVITKESDHTIILNFNVRDPSEKPKSIVLIISQDTIKTLLTFFNKIQEDSQEDFQSLKELKTKVLEILPNAGFEEDGEGQITIYTGLIETHSGQIKGTQEVLTYQELRRKIQAILPDMELDVDETNQIVIYTGLMEETDKDELVEHTLKE